MPSPTVIMAMDRASVRRVDANGYLHVEISNISKANVCPYYGSEIPGGDALGLDPDRIYMLYRDPDELARAAESFNNVPLLSRHVPVVPEHGLPEDLIIGSTGTDSVFENPYLRNSLVIWSAEYQQAIEEERQRELSCGYRYVVDMTAGRTPDGLQYDGVMREIMGNHVALVIEGRAGPDVMVGDDVMKLKSRTALLISGALQAHIRPLLAKDAKVDLSAPLSEVTAGTFAMDGAPKKLATKIAKLVKPHLAADQVLEADALASFIAGVQPIALDEDKIDDEGKQAEDEDEDEDGKQAADESTDDDNDDDKQAEDEDDEDKKQGMDAASVRRAIAKAERRGALRVAAIEVAKAEVKPLVGEVIGLDSAEAVYKFALDQADVATKGVHPSAFRAMVGMLKKPAELAQDRAPIRAGKLANIVPNLPPVIRS